MKTRNAILIAASDAMQSPIMLKVFRSRLGGRSVLFVSPSMLSGIECP
jgi:hypothetical protein